ncbi:MAG: transporter protein [Firmicutes bacterium]|nr:transporter protein [Bacillota bacterium]
MKIAQKKPATNALQLAGAYWWSNDKVFAWSLLLGVLCLNLGIVSISVLMNTWQSTFYQVIQNYDQAGFIKAIIDFGLLMLSFIFLSGYQLYLRMLLHIRWRRWLTDQYLNAWLYAKTYYRLQLMAGDKTDNPDQRVSEDIELFVSLSLRLSLDLVQDIVTILSFIFILWNLSGILLVNVSNYILPIPGYLVWAAIFYAAFGTLYTLKLGRPLVVLDFDQQRYEADFRFSLMRLRENAESIALYSGERREQANFQDRFMNIFHNYLAIATLRKKLLWLTTGYSHISIIFAIAVAAPQYFQGVIHLGQMFQITDAYRRVQEGFSFVVDSFTRIAEWRAVVSRLNNFLLSMYFVNSSLSGDYGLNISKVHHPSLTAKNLTIYLPSGRTLVNDFSLSLKPAEKLLIMGPSGCGKSTLLRALAGIWPYAKGELTFPIKDKIMFVPQKNYLPLSSLHDILLYPNLPKSMPASTLEAALSTCKLDYLIPKLHTLANWSQTLSLGEQQRIAFAQVLLQKPDWLFLDESTSAVDEKTEQVLYHTLLNRLYPTTIISVGHRQTLTNYHSTKLELDQAGCWQLSPT